MGQLPVRAAFRPIDSPVTLGMSSLAVASLVQSGLDLGWIPLEETVYVGIVTLTVPSVLPLIACVFAYVARDGATGTAAATLATTWLSLGIVQVVAPSDTKSGALGLLLIGASAALASSALAVFASKPLVGILFSLAALRFALTGVFHLSAVHPVQSASGAIGLVVVCLALYSLVAYELKQQQGVKVPSRFRRDR